MARTPSMSPQEAIAAIGVARGDLNIQDVTPERHKLLRKWATANGIPGAYAASMKRWKLVNCYNNADDADFGIKWHINQAIAKQITGDAPDEGDDSTVPAPVLPLPATDTVPVRPVTVPAPQPTAPIANDGSAGATLAALVAPYVGAAVEAQVMAKVEAVLATVHISRIELVREDRTEITIEERVHPQFQTLVRAMRSRQANGKHPNIMLVGPTGSGKTHAVEQAAQALGLEFYTNGAISQDYQLIGFKDAGGNYHETPLRKAFGRPAVYLFDEIDSSDNSPLLALAGALANNGFAFPDQFVTRHMDSVIIAAGNTWGLGANSEFVGRNKLDGAIRSRFPVRIHWQYDEELEAAICGNPSWARRVQKARSKAFAAGLKITIDPRMTQAGAGLIADGMLPDEAAMLTYLADLSPEQRNMIEAH